MRDIFETSEYQARETRNIYMLSAKRYDFEQRGTGERVRGMKIQFCFPTAPEDSDNRKGREIAESGLPYEEWMNLREVPGMYQVEFETISKGGETKNVPVAIKGYIDPKSNGRGAAPATATTAKG